MGSHGAKARSLGTISGALFATVLLLAFAANVRAATRMVTTPTDGVSGSLRSEVAAANPGDTVFLPARMGHYMVSLGEILITKAITIQGPSASSAVIDASAGTGRVFHVMAAPVSSATVTIQGVTITGGKATTMPGGGGVLVDVISSTVALDLALVNSVVSGNTATVSTGDHVCCGGGGGIYSRGGSITLTGSSVSSNTATVMGSTLSGTPNAFGDGGGGIYDNYGPLDGNITLTHSSVNHNSATVTGHYGVHGGGGIYSNGLPGNVTISGGSQVSGNSFTLNGTQTDLSGGGVSGNCCSGGGAIYQDSNLTSITNSTLTGNTATVNSGSCCHGGGAVYDDGRGGSITSSILSNNTATVNGPSGANANKHCCSGGGALAAFSGFPITSSTLDSNRSNVTAGDCCQGGGAIQIDASTPITAIGSTIRNNSSLISGGTESGGGGVYEDTGNGAKNTYTNSTISGNSTNAANAQNGGGGGLFVLNGAQTSPDVLANATIAGNTAAAGAGGGIIIDGGKLSAKNSIVATNSAAAHNDCSAGGTSPLFTSLGYNLEGAPDTCGFTGPGDKVVAAGSVGLGPLANNGGLTSTRALVAGSSAIDAGNPSGCADPAGALLTTDQRGLPRPSGAHCDIGAFEVQQAKTFPASCTLTAKGNKIALHPPKKLKRSKGALTLTVKCDQAATVNLSGKAKETFRKHGKKHTKTFKLGPITKTVSASKAVTIFLKLPKKALSALSHKAKESVKLTLTATNANGTSTATLTISKLRVRSH